MKHSLVFLAVMFLLFSGVSACVASPPQPQTTQMVRPSPSSVPPAPTITPTATPLPLPAGMPFAETNQNVMLAAMQSGSFKYIEDFAAEKYHEEDFANPGILTFNVMLPLGETIFLNYGWCAIDTPTLKQNLAQIHLKFYFNDQEIPSLYIRSVLGTRDDGWVCAHGGMLLSDWQPGTYRFRIIASFEARINDGRVDFAAGDYIREYAVTAQ